MTIANGNGARAAEEGVISRAISRLAVWATPVLLAACAWLASQAWASQANFNELMAQRMRAVEDRLLRIEIERGATVMIPVIPPRSKLPQE